MLPGTYQFLFQAKGYGLKRFKATVDRGEDDGDRGARLEEPRLRRPTARASTERARTASTPTSLLDDTESTNWAGVNPAGTTNDGVSVDTPGQHPFVNVDLAGGRQVVRSLKVSAMLRPASDTDNDADAGSRFTALRQFAIEACTESATSDCSSTLPSTAGGSPYTRVYTSPADAFNGVNPRPLAPALLEKTFDIPDTSATHLRLVALENQCTGQASYAGEQDADPLNATDCKSASTRDESVRAAELEAFGYDAQTRPPGDPVVAMTMSAPQVAAPGDTVSYTLSYRNLGPAASSNADIRIASLPTGLRFVSASSNGSWAATTRSGAVVARGRCPSG